MRDARRNGRPISGAGDSARAPASFSDATGRVGRSTRARAKRRPLSFASRDTVRNRSLIEVRRSTASVRSTAAGATAMATFSARTTCLGRTDRRRLNVRIARTPVFRARVVVSGDTRRVFFPPKSSNENHDIPVMASPRETGRDRTGPSRSCLRLRSLRGTSAQLRGLGRLVFVSRPQHKRPIFCCLPSTPVLAGRFGYCISFCICIAPVNPTYNFDFQAYYVLHVMSVTYDVIVLCHENVQKYVRVMQIPIE